MGGVGAVTAKTVVAPLDRVKILLQTGATQDGVRRSHSHVSCANTTDRPTERATKRLLYVAKIQWHM